MALFLKVRIIGKMSHRSFLNILSGKQIDRKIGSYKYVKSNNHLGGAVNFPKTIYLSLIKAL